MSAKRTFARPCRKGYAVWMNKTKIALITLGVLGFLALVLAHEGLFL